MDLPPNQAFQRTSYQCDFPAKKSPDIKQLVNMNTLRKVSSDKKIETLTTYNVIYILKIQLIFVLLERFYCSAIWKKH